MDWLDYFERNRRDRKDIPWGRGLAVPPHQRKALVRSLQRFQIGEQGDGTHLKAGASKTGDPAYAAAIALFIGEEQEHSRLLAKALGGLEAPLLRWHWSDACFTLIRRLMGLHMELLVLLIAEMIAKRYYRALHEGIDDAVLKAMCAQIRHDEEGHVAFHCAYLNRAFAPLPIPLCLLVGTGWRLLFRAFCAGVIADHRSILRATDVSPSAFWRDCGHIFDETAARIFSPVAALETLPT